MLRGYNSGMGKSAEKAKSPNLAERGSRFLRNINLLGAAALGGAAVLLPNLSPVLVPLAVIDVAQAAFFDVTMRAAAGKRKTKEKAASQSRH